MARIDLLVVIEDLVMAGCSDKLVFSRIGHVDGVCGDGVVGILQQWVKASF